MTDPTTRKERLDAMVGDYIDCSRALDKYEERKREIADEIIRELGPGARHEIAPGVGVTVSRPPRRFDPDKARAILKPEQYASICIQVPDRRQAEAMLPGALVDQLLVTGSRPVVKRMS